MIKIKTTKNMNIPKNSYIKSMELEESRQQILPRSPKMHKIMNTNQIHDFFASTVSTHEYDYTEVTVLMSTITPR